MPAVPSQQSHAVKPTSHPVTRDQATSHPVASALKICISSNRLRSEVHKKAFIEIQSQNKVGGDKVRDKQIGTFPRILNV